MSPEQPDRIQRVVPIDDITDFSIVYNPKASPFVPEIAIRKHMGKDSAGETKFEITNVTPIEGTAADVEEIADTLKRGIQKGVDPREILRILTE